MEHKVSAHFGSILLYVYTTVDSTHGWKFVTLCRLCCLCLYRVWVLYVLLGSGSNSIASYRIVSNTVIKSIACVYCTLYIIVKSINVKSKVSFVLHCPSYPSNALHCGHLLLALVAENLPCALIALTISPPHAHFFTCFTLHIHPHTHTLFLGKCIQQTYSECTFEGNNNKNGI